MHMNSAEKKIEQLNGSHRLNLAIEEENEGGMNFGNDRTLPPIHLRRCCYGRDTIIQMADGTFRRIDDIRVYERLLCYGDKMLKIGDVITGYEANLFRVETDCGNIICVSKGHPMLLADGKGKVVEALTIGEELLMHGQAHAKVTSISCVEYNDNVYNIIFSDGDDGNYLIANGFYAGDFRAQNKLEIALELPMEERRRLDNEMADLVRRLKGEAR